MSRFRRDSAEWVAYVASSSALSFLALRFLLRMLAQDALSYEASIRRVTVGTDRRGDAANASQDALVVSR